MPVAIEAMMITDYDPVRSLLNSTPGVRVRSADSREAILRFLARNPGLSFVARSGGRGGGRIVGCVMSGHDGRRGYLHHLAVEPGLRRQGIGTALVARCIEGLQALGIEKTHIDVLTDNEPAQRYWSSLKWQRRDDIVRYSFVASLVESIDPNV